MHWNLTTQNLLPILRLEGSMKIEQGEQIIHEGSVSENSAQLLNPQLLNNANAHLTDTAIHRITNILRDARRKKNTL